MPAITIGKVLAPRVHPQRWCNNGMVVDYAPEGRTRNALNHALKWHGKTLFRSPGRLVAPATTNVASRERWRGRCHTGPLVDRIGIVMTMTLPGTGVSSEDLFGRCTITPAGGAALDPVDFYYGNTTSSGSGDVPAHHRTALFLVPVNPDTTYELAFSDNGNPGGLGLGVCSRLVSAMVFELKASAHTLNGYVDPSVAVMLPILDSHRDTAYALARELWKIGGAARVDLPADLDAEVRTRTLATFVNVIDNASSSGGPAVKSDMRNRNRRSKDTVPMVLAAYGSIPSGAGVVRLVGSTSGVITAVQINNATPQWFETAFDIPAIEEDLTFLYAGSGTQEVSLRAVNLYELDAS